MQVYVVGKAPKFLVNLQENEQEKVSATIEALGDPLRFSLYIKTLHGPIRELRVGQYRIVFFQKNGAHYVVDVFRKKSQKTPRNHITYAEKWFNNL